MDDQWWISMTHCLELRLTPEWVPSFTPDGSCSPQPCGLSHLLCFRAVLLSIHSQGACHHPKAFRGSQFPLHGKQMLCMPFKALQSALSTGSSTPFPGCLPPFGHASPSSLAPTTPCVPHLCSSAHFPQCAPITSASVQTSPHVQGSLQSSFHRGPPAPTDPQRSAQQHPQPAPHRLILPLCLPVPVQSFYFRLSFL